MTTHGPDIDLADEAQTLWMDQQRQWPLLRQNSEALRSVHVRTIDLGEFAVKVQFNPARIVSTAARIDAASIGRRPCFLCRDNLPPEQRGLRFSDDYILLANPFPIFPEHFTIPHRGHHPQRIAAAFGDLLDLARALRSRYVAFYNGPRCGASAPDHLHFQAGLRNWMPIAGDYPRRRGAPIYESRCLRLYAPRSICPMIAIESADRTATMRTFAALASALGRTSLAEEEPMMNIVARYCGEDSPAGWRVIVFPRARHRPSFYGQEEGSMLISPGAVDLGGVFITPRQKDFEQLTADSLRRVFQEVMLDPDRFEAMRKELESLNSGF